MLTLKNIFLLLETESVAQAGLQLTVLPFWPPECWGYRRAPPRPAESRLLMLPPSSLENLSVLGSCQSHGGKYVS